MLVNQGLIKIKTTEISNKLYQTFYRDIRSSTHLYVLRNIPNQS